MKTADVVNKSPWNMHRSRNLLTEIIQTNNQGFSATRVPPVISWVVSVRVSTDDVGQPMPPAARGSDTKCALPTATPVPVAMEDV